MYEVSILNCRILKSRAASSSYLPDFFNCAFCLLAFFLNGVLPVGYFLVWIHSSSTSCGQRLFLPGHDITILHVTKLINSCTAPTLKKKKKRPLSSVLSSNMFTVNHRVLQCWEQAICEGKINNRAWQSVCKEIFIN